jgi:protocatechuate 3,4-dioxygenase beta subunit
MKKISFTRRALTLAAPACLLPNLLPNAALAALSPTPDTTAGPFYTKRRPLDDDADLVQISGFERQAAGDVLYLNGRVLDAGGAALPGARVEIWQCDTNGVYRHPRDRQFAMRDPAFQGFGRALADQAGRFAFRTIVPVPYTSRTPHIHVRVHVEGKARLTTQLFIKGHRQNAIDFLFHSLSSKQRRRLEMVLKPRREPSRKAFETAIDLVLAG